MNTESHEYKFSKEDVDYLLKPKAIMDKAYQIFRSAEEGRTHFDLHLDEIPSIAEFVLETTRENYPDLNIPFHSRWGILIRQN